MIVKTQTQTVSHTFVVDGREVHIPEWVVDLASFRRWCHSDEFPKEGRICYLNGEVWVDMSKEQVFSHTDVKSEFCSVLRPLIRATKLGRFLGDGLYLANSAAGLSCVPDGVFLSHESVQNGSVELIEGAREGFVEVDGTPDMVLEVVSEGSQQKDYRTLRELYWSAGIPEYWLVDARGGQLEFEILRRGPKGYTPIRKQASWVKSKVFGKSFRLTCVNDSAGHPEYFLEVQ